MINLNVKPDLLCTYTNRKYKYNTHFVDIPQLIIRYNEIEPYSKLNIYCPVIRAAVNPLSKFLSYLSYIFEEYLGLQWYPLESDNFP